MAGSVQLSEAEFIFFFLETGKVSSKTSGFKDIVARLLHQGWVCVFVVPKGKKVACAAPVSLCYASQ